MDTEEGEAIDASSLIPLDDGMTTDFGADGMTTDFDAIEVVVCLIEHHNAIFTDANETVWRWLQMAFAIIHHGFVWVGLNS